MTFMEVLYGTHEVTYETSDREIKPPCQVFVWGAEIIVLTLLS